MIVDDEDPEAPGKWTSGSRARNGRRPDTTTRPIVLVESRGGPAAEAKWVQLSHVDIRLAQTEAEAVVTVTDTGPGVSAEFLPHISAPFRQADSSTTRPHGGLGLGLALVRHLVELHGGGVAADSRERGEAPASR